MQVKERDHKIHLRGCKAVTRGSDLRPPSPVPAVWLRGRDVKERQLAVEQCDVWEVIHALLTRSSA